MCHIEFKKRLDKIYVETLVKFMAIRLTNGPTPYLTNLMSVS